MAVWVVSNCHTLGNREGFAQYLAAHIDFDVYGFCGRYACEKSYPCPEDFEKRYFFLFAFENSLCSDYVTEKLFTALRHDIVPGVFGEANYNKIAAPGSYINALVFGSPRELAEHLKDVAANVTVYKTYLTWKMKFKVTK